MRCSVLSAGGIGVMALAGLTPSSRLMVLVVALAVAAVWDLLDRRFPGRRQVDENWLTKYRSWVYGFGFGAQLGVGLATVVNTALVPVLFVAATLVDDVVVATMVGVVFGATRGFTVLLSATVRSPDEPRDLHRRIDEFDVRVRMAGALSSLSLGVVAAVALGV